MSNRKLGNDFEQQLCEILFENGFWVHNLAQNQSGQPADIIAVKDNKAFLIDAKVCSDSTFSLSRIEENQHTAMQLWEKCGNSSFWGAEIGNSGFLSTEEAWFALLIDGDIVFVSYAYLHNAIQREKTKLTITDFINCGETLNTWMRFETKVI